MFCSDCIKLEERKLRKIDYYNQGFTITAPDAFNVVGHLF